MKSFIIDINYSQDGIGIAEIRQDSITIPVGDFELTTGIVRKNDRKKSLKHAVPDGVYQIKKQIIRDGKIILPFLIDNFNTPYRISNVSPNGVKDGILIDKLEFYTEIALILSRKYVIDVYVNTYINTLGDQPDIQEKIGLVKSIIQWWKTISK